MRALGGRLLRRAIDDWPRLAPALEQYRIALKAVGHKGRTIEVFATALAAADVVLSDETVDTDSAADLAAQLDFATLPEAEDDLTDEQAWLAHLLSCVIPLDGTGSRNTVAAWLRQGVKLGAHFDAVREEADRVLGLYGLKIVRPKGSGMPEEFAIAYRGAGLERLHVGSRWAGRSGAIGPWKAAAGHLDGASVTDQRFATGHAKGVKIPLRVAFPLGLDDDPEDQGAASPRSTELPLRDKR